MVRRAVAKGTFYPDSKDEISQTLNQIAKIPRNTVNAQGVILPHAGYIYSARVAAQTIAKVTPRKKLIILGPNHTGIGENFSIMSEGSWEIPGKNIPIDHKLAAKILDNSQIIKEDPSAHLQEHSIEVELPILDHFFGQFSFVPICCQQDRLEVYQQVAQDIFQAIKSTNDDVLIVASSDMNHYEDDATTRNKDRSAIESILNCDEAELINRIKGQRITMCGAGPAAILISCCKLLKAQKAEVVLYQTSGDVNKDYSSVVGYLGVIIK
jgi:hypothetical protein